MRLDPEDLIENSKLKVNNPPKKNNNVVIIGILVGIVITLIVICIIMALMKDIQPIDTSMKIYVDGKETKLSNSIFLIENNKLYVSVRGIASIAGYEAHSGEYKIEAEDVNKVFVENKQETASMFLNSKTISKVEPNTNDEYKDFSMSEPAREVDGEIYVISDGIEIACNIKIAYDSSKNIVNIQTLPYIFELYDKAVQNRGFLGVSNEFENQKALLYDRIIIQNSDGRYGVIDSSGEEIIGTRYANIKFNEYNKEFTIINSYGKVGIDYIDGETKINVNYDEIKSVQKEKGLYLVKSNGKYGVIDSDEKIIIHMEYDDIGVDISPYTMQTNISNKTSNSLVTDKVTNDSVTKKDTVKQYIFYDVLVPVKQGDLWGFFNLSENKLSTIKYTDIGCRAKKAGVNDTNNNQTSVNSKNTSNLLLIEEYKLIVVEQNGKYSLVNTSAQELFKPEADDMYSIVNAGVRTYYMLYNGKTYDLERDILKGLGLERNENL